MFSDFKVLIFVCSDCRVVINYKMHNSKLEKRLPVSLIRIS